MAGELLQDKNERKKKENTSLGVHLENKMQES